MAAALAHACLGLVAALEMPQQVRQHAHLWQPLMHGCCRMRVNYRAWRVCCMMLLQDQLLAHSWWKARALDPNLSFRLSRSHTARTLQGVACQALRRDPDLGNISMHNSMAPAPPTDPINLVRTSTSLKADKESIGRFSNWKDIFMLRASPKHLMRYNKSFPIPVIGELLLHCLHSVVGCVRHHHHHPHISCHRHWL